MACSFLQLGTQLFYSTEDLPTLLPDVSVELEVPDVLQPFLALAESPKLDGLMQIFVLGDCVHEVWRLEWHVSGMCFVWFTVILPLSEGVSLRVRVLVLCFFGFGLTFGMCA